jgi:hypothetical protein
MSEFSYDPNWKLRVVVDGTLQPGEQLAQALHAAIEFANDHPSVQARWHALSNSVVVMSATTEQLHQLLDRCQDRELQHSVFVEPDMDDRLTAVCVEPTREGKRVTSNYPLALKGL